VAQLTICSLLVQWRHGSSAIMVVTSRMHVCQQWFKELEGRIMDLHTRGWSDVAISKHAIPKGANTSLMETVTLRDVSRLNLVQSVLYGPIARPEVDEVLSELQQLHAKDDPWQWAWCVAVGTPRTRSIRWPIHLLDRGVDSGSPPSMGPSLASHRCPTLVHVAQRSNTTPGSAGISLSFRQRLSLLPPVSLSGHAFVP